MSRARRSKSSRTEAPVVVADTLSFLINKLFQNAGRGMSAALAPLGLAPRESGILAALAQYGPMSQQRIGELLVIDRTTMVLGIDHLEELEFVERTAHPTDRRIFLVALTERGQSATFEARRLLGAFEDDLLSPLSSVERAGFRDALYRIVRGSLHPDVRIPGDPT